MKERSGSLLKLGTFTVDCTPPIGCPVSFGDIGATVAVRDPLYLRGFVLDDGQVRCLIAALDYCGLMNSAYDELAGALAEATDISPKRVIIHCVHQHDTPLLNFEIEAYLHCKTYPRQWWAGLVQSCARAAAESLDGMATISSLGYNETRVHGFASNRRVLRRDGTVGEMRSSRCEDAALRDEPAGVIDPMLRTVAFKDSEEKIAGSMSFYATHPQVSNGRDMYSADAPGEALRIAAGRCRDGLHAFFTGAGGNVAAGKYSSTTDLEGNLLKFGQILADGISLNLDAMRWEEAQSLHWHVSDFPFPRQQVGREELLRLIDDEGLGRFQRLQKAVLLTCFENVENSSYHLSLLRTGPIRILFLPGEPFVEYQLFAQSLIPDEFLALAGNCGDNFLYLPLARSFAEGGYEVSTFCWCTEAFESRIKAVLAELLSTPMPDGSMS